MAAVPKKDPTKDIPEEIQEALKFLVHKYEKEDSWVRKQQIKLWKKNSEFWHGIQYIFWSESRQDWLLPVETRWFQEDEGREGVEGPFYDFVINIYRSHGESIISALAAQVPAVRFPPDDAEDDDDLLTSKTYAKIADLIQRHNTVKNLMFQSFLTAWNQGNVYWYHAPKSDRTFGITHIENYKKVLSCPNCQQEVPVDDEEDLLQGLHSCPNCGSPLQVQTVLDSIQESPKSRVLIESYGGLFVKTSFWARDLRDSGYLILQHDRPKPLMKYIYPWIAEKIDSSESDAHMYERMGRTPSSFTSFNRADDNRDLVTHRQVWLRSWAYEGLPADKEDVKKKLYKLYPNGVYVAEVGKIFADADDQDMDKYWSVFKPGLADYLHADALGQPLIPVQELRNIVINLTAETVEQSIGSFFADPDVLNFGVYAKHEARPGYIYPARPRPGQDLNASFFETGRATLSKEVGDFLEQLDKDGQFSVGDYPSLYGGPGEVASRTLGEYQQSRVQALQRLSICWSLFVTAWAKLMEKCVHLYVENLIEDERFTAPDPNKKDNYINVWIRKADMTGHVGEVEPVGADSFPMSIPQKQGLFYQLLQLNNEFINQALFDPQNRRIIADLVGFTDLYIPGEEQQIKQASEIGDMLRGIPVPIDPIVDDSVIHIEGCRNFLASERGMELKKMNPPAFQLIEQHLQQHLQTQLTQQQEQQTRMAQVYANVKAQEQVTKTAIRAMEPAQPRNGSGQFK